MHIAAGSFQGEKIQSKFHFSLAEQRPLSRTLFRAEKGSAKIQVLSNPSIS